MDAGRARGGQQQGDVPGLAHFLSVVEWAQVRESIAARTAAHAGSHRARELEPSTDPAVVRARQERTAAARGALDADAAPALEGVSDIGAIFGRAGRLGRGLTARELRAIAVTVEVGAAAREALAGWPALLALVAAGREDEAADLELAREVLAKVDEHGRVLDDASEGLARVRADLEVARHELVHALGQLALDPALLPALAEFKPAVHDGHPCLRVKAKEVRRVDGPIRAEAPDGTLFVEPDRARAQYNRIRHLELDERVEVQRVVAALAGRVERRREVLCALADGLIELDVHLALARWARDLGMVAPALAEGGPGEGLVLRRARHPLLAHDAACVPLDLALDADRRAVVISGPNGGGKTVAMKTVGLLAALAQAGAWVPADAGTRLPIFPRLLAVADARSSVSAGLSHFQAHAHELAACAEAVVPGALVLLDEIGHGTDPGEAAALAQAFVEHLLARPGVLVLATTHLGPLKAFAERTPGLANASVALGEDGAPTFRLEVGRAGRSYALEVARACGLPDAVCARAEALHAGEA